MKETWWTSDWHFNHERIIELCQRPFGSVEEMNETIIENHNKLVRPGDEVFVLGDVALGKISEFPALVQRMNGRKYLIPGNHDRCWKGHKRVRGVDTELYINAGFEILSGISQFSETGWLMCHFPAAGDSLDHDRYVDFRPTIGENEWLLHGHVHEKWQIKDRQINVGVDAWEFKPVSRAEIEQIIELSSNR